MDLMKLVVTVILVVPCILLQLVTSTFHHNHDHRRLKYSTEVQYVEVESQDPNDVHFYLYPDSQDPAFREELILNDVGSIQDSEYEPNMPVIILIHGFVQNFLSSFPQLVKDAYLDASFTSKANIICVDWGKLSTPATEFPIPILGDLVDLLSYHQAVANVPVVGRRVEQFILFLISGGFLPGGCGSVHIVGHSLGAHVAGLTSQSLMARSSTGSLQIGRITGTDPALPLFHDLSKDARLDSSDAEFVDIIHTNQGELGYNGPIGSVDFFVNGGGPSPQPGCAELDLACSHNMAFKFYAASIAAGAGTHQNGDNGQIHACPCVQARANEPNSNVTSWVNKPCPDDEKVVFGQFIQTSARGSYCLGLHLNLQQPQMMLIRGGSGPRNAYAHSFK